MSDERATRGYRAVLSEDPDDGSWAAEVPDLPGCVAAGTSPSEVIGQIGDAIDAWIATAAAVGRQVPSPSCATISHSGRFLLRVPRGLHGRLVRAAEGEGVSLNTYCATVLAEAVGAGAAQRQAPLIGVERVASGRA
jgi:antitoxin HicB